MNVNPSSTKKPLTQELILLKAKVHRGRDFTVNPPRRSFLPFLISPYNQPSSLFSRITVLQDSSNVMEELAKLFQDADITSHNSFSIPKYLALVKAKEEYFSYERTLKRNRTVDKKILQASPLKNREIHFQTIQNYWEMIARSSQPRLLQDETESHLFSLFGNLTQAVNLAFHRFKESCKNEPQNQTINLIHFLTETIKFKLKETHRLLLEKQELALTEEESIQLKYLILKGYLIAPSFAKFIIYQQTLHLKRETEERVQSWLPYARESNEIFIDLARHEVEKAKESLIKFEAEYPLQNLLTLKKHHVESQQEILKKFEEKDPYDDACLYANEDPRQFDNLMPKLTPYDHSILKLYGLSI